jgi:hypothetical protein
MTGEEIQKRSPLEQAIAEKKDRRVRYERSMRDRGFLKTNLWIISHAVDDVKAAIRTLNEGNTEFAGKLRDLLDDRP